MIDRRTLLGSAVGVLLTGSANAQNAFAAQFDRAAFAAAQAAERPILIVVEASWCPTCVAQKPILSSLLSQQKFSKMLAFSVDFDTRQDALQQFRARSQSTLIVFRGATEVGRSVGDTRSSSIEALLTKAI